MRLFIAIELPSEVNTHLRELQEKIKGVKVKQASSFHLTLKFLGEVAPVAVADIQKRLSLIKVKPLRASLGKIGFFPSKEAPNVIWVGLEPEDEIRELQSAIETVLAGLFPREKHFQPHLTLSRIKERLDRASLLRLSNIVVKEIDFKINGFKLIESKLNKDGPNYTTLASFPQ